ncbi:MAG TPA: S41 family peptidase [Pseudomonas xinjiangensis]|uniref:S41 family peptidase n=2 Tax=root TaxID=1 RepID=A0A7V1BM08_9GAMM|nr:S41 family peptidase [Halopseudomonas xinjiangensis]HEC48407.1 S41 family peptidase [Halopseudomonas xinjiangensis]
MTAARTLFATCLSVALVIGPAQAQEPPQEQLPAAPLPLDELRTFAEVLERIRAAYVEPIDDVTLLNNAIRGMLEGLDPHSAYLEPDEFRGLQDTTSGQFGGLGLEVGQEDGFIKVISPIDNTPAAKAGIEAGDLIVKIDDQPVKGMSLMDAVEKMRGAAGTKVVLTLVRDAGSPFDVELSRAVVKVDSLRTEELEDGYAYLRITQFQTNTGDELRRSLAKLTEGDSLKGIVLDLRNNPGGVLQSAVEVADSFLDEGLIVYTKGRLPNSEMRFNATANDPAMDVPLVVLINGGSASASEIVAGALQDHGRAVIMGTDSFGKGSVQTVLPLNNDRALKLTTALYYTPDGRSIQAQGIEPDIRVDRARLSSAEVEAGYREVDLAGHLDNGSSEEGPDVRTPITQGERQQDTDYQLNQALNLLKGLNIARANR